MGSTIQPCYHTADCTQPTTFAEDPIIIADHTLIEQTRGTLDQLRSQKAYKETLKEQGRKEIDEQVQEVNNIVTRTQSLSKQLIEDTNI